MTTYKEVLNLTNSLATKEEVENKVIGLPSKLFKEIEDLYTKVLEEESLLGNIEELLGIVNRNAFITGKGYIKAIVAVPNKELEDKDKVKAILEGLALVGLREVTIKPISN